MACVEALGHEALVASPCAPDTLAGVPQHSVQTGSLLGVTDPWVTPGSVDVDRRGTVVRRNSPGQAAI